MELKQHYDVVIIGAGLAGLSLARQLQLERPGISILMLEKRSQVPPVGQKVGEATVQVSGYYFSKVLQLEEYLMREHFLKYNLRFFWKTEGRANDRYEDYCQSYIRSISNVASYQLDRNKIEGELLRRNQAAGQFDLQLSIIGHEVELNPSGPHTVTVMTREGARSVTAGWFVDAAGRAHTLAKKRGLERKNAIKHGTSFFWVEGLVNVEELTDSTPKQIRLNPARREIGHLPFWLATNHFCGEGYWFWVIPLQGLTSFGLVYDQKRVNRDDVNTPTKLVEWICKQFPLFARDLPHRPIVHHGCINDFSFDCAQTIDASKWAIIGEAGRFTDPLYSPGSDLISIHNTLVTDAILTEDPSDLPTKTPLYESLLQAFYGAYIPSYVLSYDALGNQETMTLKYVWELTIYFGFYVFAFINGLLTDRRFIVSFLKTFSRLGRLNASLQTLINGYYHWKKTAHGVPTEPRFNDFMDFGALMASEKAFYKVGVTIEEARMVLDEQYANVAELARFIAAHIHASVLGDRSLVQNRRFVESLDIERLVFDIDAMSRARAAAADCTEQYPWPWCTKALDKFCTPRLASGAPASAPIMEHA